MRARTLIFCFCDILMRSGTQCVNGRKRRHLKEIQYQRYSTNGRESLCKRDICSKKESSPKILNHSHFTGLSYNSIIVAHVNYSV